jgi:hypothetical protein
MTDTTGRTIHVYRESPVWNRYDRWFNVPLSDLNALFVASYMIEGDAIDDGDVQRCAAALRQQHPDCVFVY